MIITSMSDLERAKLSLRNDFEKMPYTRIDLLGNAACSRKIRSLIVAYILDGIELTTCNEETKSLMIESGVSDESFEKEIKPEIDAYYKAKDLIDKGYCNDLRGL